MMETAEAFRISVGKLHVDRLVEDQHKLYLDYQNTITRVLAPLRLEGRLQFVSSSDLKDGNDWLVVKVEASRQLALLSADCTGVSGADLDRECAAAEILVNRAMNLFRKMVSFSRMSPVELITLINTDALQFTEAQRIEQLAHNHEDGTITLRNPRGQDLTVKAQIVSFAVTLPEIKREGFLVDLVGNTLAMVRRVREVDSSPRPVGKAVSVVWGNIAPAPEIRDKFIRAMTTRSVLQIHARETYSPKGKVVRLEWCDFD